jgi:hypothetical protein
MINTFPIGSKHRTSEHCGGAVDNLAWEWREFAGNLWRRGHRGTARDVVLPQRRCLKLETLDETFGAVHHA